MAGPGADQGAVRSGPAGPSEQRRLGALTGHMVRAQRMLGSMLSVVDVVWEVADARSPRASRNPYLARVCAGKPRVVVLAKADLAEAGMSQAWAEHLQTEAPALPLDLRAGHCDLDALRTASQLAMERGGARARPGGFRAVVAGIPNTGKSTLLNRVAGGHAAVGARPGVTRGEQWIGVPGGGQVLDLPGVLPPRLAAWPAIWRLWAIGALTVHAVDEQRAAAALLAWIADRAPNVLRDRYGLDEATAWDHGLAAIARRRGLLGQGGVADETRAAQVLLADFRRGWLGTVTLEDPPAIGPASSAQPSLPGCDVDAPSPC